MPQVKPKARDDLTVVELDGEAVIYNDDSSELHHLNATATILFGMCDGAATMKDMSIVISETFGMPIEEVEPQVRTLIRQFRKASLLTSSRPVVGAGLGTHD